MKKQFNIRTYKVENGKFIKGGYVSFDFGITLYNKKMHICINKKVGSRLTLEHLLRGSIKKMVLQDIDKYIKEELPKKNKQYLTIPELKEMWGNGARLKRIKRKFLIDFCEESRDKLSEVFETHFPYENN